MKNLKLINLLLIVATSLLLVNCTTEPIYPEGAAGADGIDGVDGTNGIDGATGTTECAACHNISTSEGVHTSYLFSAHAAGGAVGYAGNRGGCADCHSNEGYIDYVTLGASNPEGYNGMATPISCNTCHDTHSTFDFENEGFDYALRSFGPVDLIINDALPAPVTLNFMGTSNNCATCHQPRHEAPIDDGSGVYTVYNRYGPHHGPQATFLEGIQGGEVAGALEYPSAGSALHRTGASCTSCHMGATSGETDGNHTWIPTPTSCTECHSTIPSGVAGLEEDMKALEGLLVTNGLIDADGKIVLGDYPIAQAQALWNYVLINEDASMGVHNPNYSKALVKNSIEALSVN